MKSIKNDMRITGYLYDVVSSGRDQLKKAVTGPNSKNPGTEYISGGIYIAIDEEGVNTVPVYFTYVTEHAGKQNRVNETFTILDNIIEGNYKTWMKGGKDGAVRLSVQASIGVNEWYDDDGQYHGDMRNAGSTFGLHILNDEMPDSEEARAHFEVDTIITKVTEVDADPERNTPAYALLGGYTFDWRKELYPVSYRVYKPAGISYFLKQEPSSKKPFFTKVNGYQVSQVVERKEVEESAFGEDIVHIRKTSNRAYVADSCSKFPYAWDDEETITALEMKEAVSNMEVRKADVKRQRDEWKARQANGGASVKPAASNDDYDF